MKRRWSLIISTLVCAMFCALGVVACGNGADPSGSVTGVSGTYYRCDDDVMDSQIYITFRNGKWTDDEGETGEYTVSGNVITLYVEAEDIKTEFATGTIEDNDITLYITDEYIVYRKGEDVGNIPQEKTLNFALNSAKTGYIVKGIGGLTGDIEIPDEYKRKPVVEISENAFANNKDITSVVIGDNVVAIGEKAFYKCTNLTSAVLGESVGKLVESTFEGCTQLESVTISASVKNVEYDVFKDCSALVDIHFTGTASDWAAIYFEYEVGYEGSITTATPFFATYLTSTGLKEINRKLYIDDELLTAADMTEATAINPLCFFRYKYLESVTIGGDADTIGEYAFYGCTNLTTLRFDDSALRVVGMHAFDGDCGVSSVNLPDSVKRIEKFAFNNCERLNIVNTGNGTNYIGEGAFMGCGALATLTLGSSVAEICETAFYSCNALTTVTIPSSAIFIGAEAFMYTGLTSATFNNTSGWKVQEGNKYTEVEGLNDTAKAATLLKTSILSNGYSDYDWEKQTLQYTLSSDGTYYIVKNNGTVCRSEIVIPEKYMDKPVRKLASDAFDDCASLVSLTLPSCMLDIPTSAFYGCTSLENITVYHVNNYENVYATREGVLYNDDYSQIILIPAAKTEITIYGDIAEGMFYNYTTLRKVIIADGATSIGDNAFSGCSSLTSIIIPDTVASIGSYAFSGCSGLTNIIIPDTVTSIGDNAFFGCPNLIIYCEAASQPEGWSEYWGDLSPIIWDYKKSDKDEYGNVYTVIGGIRYQLKDGVATVFGLSSNITVAKIVSNVTYKNVTYCVKSIKNYAFENCSKLTSITIPDSVTSIGSSVFSGCTGLTSITVSDDNPHYSSQDGILYNKAKTEFICIPYAITGAVIPNTITSIGYKAFKGRSRLTSITIPNSVTSIESSAFNGCDKLSNIAYTGDIKGWCSINGLNALMSYGASNKTLTIGGKEITGELVIPDSVTSIGSYAFRGCVGLTSITIPNSVASIGSSAFYGCPIETATIPALAAEYIKNSTLKTVVITSGNIGDYAFEDCSGLTSVNIGNNVTSIGYRAFYCCGLTSIIIPRGVKSIKSYAFENCSKLTSITISDSVTSIGSSVFSGCTGLTSITVSDDNLNYSSQDGILYNKAKTEFICIPYAITGVGIPNTITSIWNEAFKGRSSLTSITIPDSVTSIGTEAFNGCDKLSNIAYSGDIKGWCSISGLSGLMSYGASNKTLTIGGKEIAGELVIPDSVTSIGSYAFRGCVGLTSITIPNSVMSIGSYAFTGCDNLQYNEYDNAYYLGNADNPYLVLVKAKSENISSCSINSKTKIICYSAFFGCSKLTSIIIPDGITNIGDGTFYNCISLTSVTIPDSVTSIGSYAFCGCYRLTNITFQGTKSQWYAISKDFYWNINTDNYTIHCTNGDILKS